jgi:hypothetical protein
MLTMILLKNYNVDHTKNQMKQYHIRASNFNQEPDIPDAIMDPVDLHEIKTLAGCASTPPAKTTDINISHTAMEKVQLMKKHNIKPGDPEWFSLWFRLPYLTNEPPVK